MYPNKTKIMTAKRFKKNVSKPIIDFLLGKTMGKKLTMMIIATVALFNGFLDGDNFTFILIVYVSVEGGYNYIKAWVESKQQNMNPFDNRGNVGGEIPPDDDEQE